MELALKLASIFFTMILVDNYVLAKFLGICPFLGVSKKLDSAVGMSLAVTFVMVMATAATWPIYTYILSPEWAEGTSRDLGYLQTIVFILIIAILVQLLENVLKKFIPALYKALGVYLPLITTNCTITITLTIMGTIREILGSGTWMAGLDGLLPFLPEGFKIQVIPTSVDPFTLMTSAPGGFFVFGVMMAAATWLTTRPKKEKKPAETVEGGNA